MNNVFFGIITLSIVAAVGVFIYVMIELKGTIKAVKEFLNTTENTLNPTLEELRHSLKSLRHLTDNATVITEDMKTLSASAREVGENVRQVSRIVNGITAFSVIHVPGLKAGIKAATEVIVRSLLIRSKKPNKEKGQ